MVSPWRTRLTSFKNLRWLRPFCKCQKFPKKPPFFQLQNQMVTSRSSANFGFFIYDKKYTLHVYICIYLHTNQGVLFSILKPSEIYTLISCIGTFKKLCVKLSLTLFLTLNLIKISQYLPGL